MSLWSTVGYIFTVSSLSKKILVSLIFSIRHTIAFSFSTSTCFLRAGVLLNAFTWSQKWRLSRNFFSESPFPIPWKLQVVSHTKTALISKMLLYTSSPGLAPPFNTTFTSLICCFVEFDLDSGLKSIYGHLLLSSSTVK